MFPCVIVGLCLKASYTIKVKPANHQSLETLQAILEGVGAWNVKVTVKVRLLVNFIVIVIIGVLVNDKVGVVFIVIFSDILDSSVYLSVQS